MMSAARLSVRCNVLGFRRDLLGKVRSIATIHAQSQDAGRQTQPTQSFDELFVGDLEFVDGNEEWFDFVKMR